MSRFYSGAARIEGWLNKPRVERFADAATMWYLVLLGVLFVALVLFVLIALALTVAGVWS